MKKFPVTVIALIFTFLAVFGISSIAKSSSAAETTTTTGISSDPSHYSTAMPATTAVFSTEKEESTMPPKDSSSHATAATTVVEIIPTIAHPNDFKYGYEYMDNYDGVVATEHVYITVPNRPTTTAKIYSDTEGELITGEYNEIKWSLDISTGVLKYEGSGTVLPLADTLPRQGYNIKKIIIGDKITALADNCFNNYFPYNLFGLTDVVLLDSVESVGKYAFAKCPNLKNVTLSKNLVYLGEQAFDGCNALQKIEIPDSVESIGIQTFWHCSSLETVVFGKNLKEIGLTAFADCTSLKEVVIPDSVEIIGHKAFENCTSLESVTFGKNLKTIGDYSFRNCIALYEINVPDSAEYIGHYAFANCLNLKKINGGNGIKNLGLNPFNGTAFYLNSENWEDGMLYLGNILIGVSDSVGKNCVIKDGTKIIYNNALANRTFNSVQIPESVETIGAGAFHRCFTYEQPITIPDTVKNIGALAFSDCSIDKNTVISANVESLGGGVFAGSKTTAFLVDKNNPYYTTDEYGVIYTKDMKKLVAYPKNCAAQDYVIPEGVKEIGDFAFTLSDLRSISIPDSVETIGHAAFADCRNLKSLSLPDNLKKMEKPHSIIYGCSLDYFDTGDGLTSASGFYNSSVKHMKLGKSIDDPRLIGSSPYSLISYEVDPENPYFSTDADGILYSKDKSILFNFPHCSPVENYVMPSETKYMSRYVFSDCYFLKTVTFSENLCGTYYNDSPTFFKSYIHPDTKEEISVATGEFYNFDSEKNVPYRLWESNIEKYIVPEGNKFLYAGADGVLFSKDKSVLISYPSAKTDTSYTVPDGVKIICDRAFDGNQSLTEVTVPDSVDTVGNAFTNCSNLQKLNLPDKPMFISGELVNGSALEHNEDNWENDFLYIGNHLIRTRFDWNDYLPRNVIIKSGTTDIASNAFTLSYPYESSRNIVGIYIPKTVKRINYDVFYHLYNLRDIYFEGTEEEWNAIEILHNEKYFLSEVTIHYNITYLPPDIVPEPSPETLVDEKTGVSVDIDSSKYGGEVEIIVEENIDDGSAFDVITTETEVNDFALYDITMTLDGSEIQPCEWVTVRLPLPENFDPERSMVFYVSVNGTGYAQQMEARYEDGFMVFETNHFSYYAIVEAAETEIEIPLPTVAFSHGDLSLYYKHNGTVKATASAGNVIYTSSDPDVVSVDESGNITAKKTGSAVITATVEGTDVSVSCNVTVSYTWWQWIIRILLLGIFWY